MHLEIVVIELEEQPVEEEALNKAKGTFAKEGIDTVDGGLEHHGDYRVAKDQSH